MFDYRVILCLECITADVAKSSTTAVMGASEALKCIRSAGLMADAGSPTLAPNGSTDGYA